MGVLRSIVSNKVKTNICDKLCCCNEGSLPWKRRRAHKKISITHWLCVQLYKQFTSYKQKQIGGSIVVGFYLDIFVVLLLLLIIFLSGIEKWGGWWWWDPAHWSGHYILSLSYFLCLHLSVVFWLFDWRLLWLNQEKLATDRALTALLLISTCFVIFLSYFTLSDYVLIFDVF